MPIIMQNRQLVKVAGSINLLALLLSVMLILYLGFDHNGHQDIIKKIIKFMLANSCCWIIDLSILIFLLPRAPKWKNARWLFFYLPSYLVTFSLAIIIARSFLHEFISDEPTLPSISGTLFFVMGINTLSLVAIELILTRYAQARIRGEIANMKAENAELRMKSLQAQHEKLKNQLHPHFLFNSLTALD